MFGVIWYNITNVGGVFMKALIIVALLIPINAFGQSDKENLYLEWLNYRLNNIQLLNEVSKNTGEIAKELKAIRCKLPPIEDDCFHDEKDEGN